MLLLTVMAVRGGSAFPGQAPQVRYILDDLVDWIAPRREMICYAASILAGVFLYIRSEKACSQRSIRAYSPY